MASGWNWIRAWLKQAGLVACLVTATWALPCAGQSLTVPFTEAFVANNSNWLISLVPSGAAAAPWSSSGGVDGSGFISSSRTMSTAQFNQGAGAFGFILFRGNAANDASGDAFVGDWLTGGVTEVSTYVRHDAPENLNVYVRLDSGSGRAGSSVPFSVPSNTWTRIAVPIVDSVSSFQSYGAGTFSTVFANIQNVQIALSDTQPVGVLDGTTTYTFGIDSVAVVPEPSGVALALAAAGCAAGYWGRRRAAGGGPNLERGKGRSS